MILWGFIALLVGFVACLVLFLSNLDLFSQIRSLGFSGYVQEFFAKENVNTQKVCFLIFAVLFILGIVLYFVGRSKNKKSGAVNPVIPVKVTKFFRDTRGEFKKIAWPTFPAVVRNTGATLAMCAVTAVVIIVVDAGLGQLIKLLLSL